MSKDFRDTVQSIMRENTASGRVVGTQLLAAPIGNSALLCVDLLSGRAGQIIRIGMPTLSGPQTVTNVPHYRVFVHPLHLRQLIAALERAAEQLHIPNEEKQ